MVGAKDVCRVATQESANLVRFSERLYNEEYHKRQISYQRIHRNQHNNCNHCNRPNRQKQDLHFGFLCFPMCTSGPNQVVFNVLLCFNIWTQNFRISDVQILSFFVLLHQLYQSNSCNITITCQSITTSLDVLVESQTR